MSASLVPCTACARHIRATEDACPFCRDGAPDRTRLPAEAARVMGTRLSRAALILAGATAVAGCGKTTAKQPPEDTSIAAPYGAPPMPMDAGPEITPRPPAPAYGAPPPMLEPSAKAPSTTKDGGAGKR